MFSRDKKEISGIKWVKMLSKIDIHMKLQAQSQYYFLTQNFIFFKIALPWCHLHLELFQDFMT